ncbi:hypothetical protein MTP99_019460 [Tenebrio molitor]|nr:hypothetical protein MTP99_019460 [Tenebrio molitor]
MTAELKTGKANQDPAQQSELQANMAATQTMGARERELAQGTEGLQKRGAEPRFLLTPNDDSIALQLFYNLTFPSNYLPPPEHASDPFNNNTHPTNQLKTHINSPTNCNYKI